MSKFMMRITRVMIMMFSYVCATLPVTPDSTMIITWAPDTEFNLKNYRIYYGDMSKSSEPNPGVLYHFAITAYDNRGNGNPEVNVVKQAGDEMPLAIISVEPVTPILLKIVFNRAVDRKSAEQISHYKIVPPVAIEKASLQANATTVFLFTKPHQVNTTYRLTVTNLQDKASPPNTISSQEYTLNPDPGVSNIVLTEHSTVANYSIKTNHLILKNLMIPIAPSYTEGLMWINGIHRTRSSEEISHIHFDMDQEITLFV
ncbi:MAG: hypothetical protein ONB05_11475, partial [candidate division KSB1 bacterium]|nr:hypothetical protein [candidate division KSB1 bacterium]